MLAWLLSLCWRTQCKAWQRRAVALLAQAARVENYARRLREDRDLDPLRGREDFRKVLTNAAAATSGKK